MRQRRRGDRRGGKETPASHSRRGNHPRTRTGGSRGTYGLPSGLDRDKPPACAMPRGLRAALARSGPREADNRNRKAPSEREQRKLPVIFPQLRAILYRGGSEIIFLADLADARAQPLLVVAAQV